MGKKVMVAMAEGSEELEAVAVIDILRRAKAEVDVVTIGDKVLNLSKGVKIVAEKSLSEVLDLKYDLVVLPGGMPGSEKLRDSKDLIELIKRHISEGSIIAAICASPAIVLDYHGLTKGKKISCHPSFSHLVKNGTYSQDPVTVDGNLVTGKGAGYSIEFALKLLEILFPRDTVEEVKKGLTLI